MYEGEKGKGQWVKKNDMPDHWPVSFDDLHLSVRLAPYKHTGVFPEQQQNWDWMRAESKASGRPLRILNLFAYTGGASVALAKDGHFVTHTDSSKPAIGWAQENAVLNAISSEKIRWMLEDATSFVKKEIKRGKTYDAILLDPPAYGHGTGGKTWRVERDLAPLLEQCVLLLSDKPCFMALNGYSHNDSSESFHKLLTGILHQKSPQKTFSVTAKKLFLTTEDGLRLETGIVARVKF
jgi:23S rRNA (cytosine1962-C5)-methyltransferase